MRITALHEVSVQALDNIHYTTDGYLALPESELGTEYLAASFPGLGYPAYHVDGTVTVAAADDDTAITITPTTDVAPGIDTPASMPAGVPFTLTLDRGEILTLHAQALGADLSGTEINASAPIAVFGGHQCAYVPTDEPYCDHLVEMLPPVATWGTAFVKAAYHQRTNGDLVRVLASADDTVVSVDGVPVATLGRGETWERGSPVETFEVIETSAPALAWQLERGHQAYHIGDPSVALLTPISQWPTEVWGYALPLRYTGGIGAFGSGYTARTGLSTSLNIVARTADVNGFVLGGAPLIAQWNPIGTSPYARTRIAISPDRPIHLAHRAPAVSFGAWLSGLFQYDSYGYPLGSRLAPIANPCTPQLSVAGNGLDDDCDGAVDEELGDATDQDGDGLVDEDLAAGQVAVNSAPVVGSFTLTTDEDVSVDVVLQGSDANGDALTFAVTQPPAHGTLTGTPPVLRYVPDPNWPGTGRGIDSFRYVANDGQLDSAPGTYTIALRNVNDLPVITSTAPASASEDALYAYGLTWSDADPQDRGAVSFDAAPAGMAWNAATSRIEWTPTNAQVGSHAVTVRVTDLGQGAATQSFAVTVANTNDAPAITSAPELNAIAGGLYAYDVEAFDVDLGDTLGYSLATAPAGMAIDATTGAITWTSAPADAGTHPIVVEVRDAANATATQSFSLEVDADANAPIVTVLVQPARVNVGESATVTVLAIDEAAVAGRQLTIAGSPVALDASFQATFTATAAGAVPIVATAIDPSGNLGMASSALAVRDAADVTPPVVDIDTPVEDAELTFLTDVTGSATDTNFYKWTLARQLAGDDTWTEFAAGYAPVTAATLGTLDPTLLENGIYLVRLRAEDVNGASAEVIRGLRIDGQAKIGIFRISFVDLTIPLGGIPISVVRSYDSRVTETRDFGIGWDLDISAGRVQHKVDLADGWVIATLDDPFSLPCQIVVDQKAHLTEVRLSERERYVFRPTLFNGLPLSGGCLGDVGFELVDGTTPGAELYAVGNTSVRAPGAIIDEPGDPIGFNGTLTDPETGLPYEARDFQLRTEDGRVFDLNLVRGVVRIADRNENELFINANGIVSSSGKSITFTRDGAGRITRITDPMSRTLDYGYDAAGDLTSFTNQTADATTFTYGTVHDLQEIHDPNGVRAAKQEYDATGRLVAVVDADGHRIELVHDLVAREETREDRLGFRETFTYDARGNVTEQVDREGKVWTYAYDTADNQTSATDPLGNTTTATFDASHRKTSETNPLGDTRAWTYDARGNVLTETDFDGKTTTNTYDARGNLLTTTAPDGTVTTFTHDLQGNPTSITNALGHVATATYNIDGNLIATTDPAGHVVRYVYDAANNTLRTSETRTLPSGTTETLTTRFQYDAANRLTETTDPLGNRTKTEYDRNGRVVAQVDPLGRRDESVYDELGRLVEQRAPDGATQRSSYDAEDQLTARIDEAGRSTSFFYDGTGRPTRTRYVDDTETVSSYDDAGRLTRVVDRRGYDTAFGYDDAGRQTLVRDALDHEASTTYDEAGRRLTVTDANGRTTSFAYDEAGRLTTTTFADGTTSTTEYDALGRVVAEIDPKGTRTEFEYDALGRLTLVRDADGGETTYSYDELGNRVAMTDALGRVRKYEYDGLGRMTAEGKPLGQRKTMRFDAVGQLTSTIDYNGRTATRSYDPRGRVIHEQHADGSATSYAYTVTGQLALVQDATGVTTYAYDDQDRLVEQVRPGGATLRYGYDAEGNRTRLEVPSGTTLFAYDAVGRPTTILDPQGGLTTYGYDAANNRASLTQPNGVTTTYARDERDRLTTIESRTATNTLLARYAYTLDTAGNRTGVTESSGRTATWQYDTLYRLVAETITESAGSPETESFGYDAVGNRVFRATDAGVETSTYDDNDRLLDDGTATYTWDEQGNLRSKTDASGTTQYRWDGRDRLIEVSGPATGLVQHVYDNAGDRIETRVDGVATKYLVDANRGLSQILEERSASGSLIASYVHGDDGTPLARFDGSTATASHYLHDAQQSVRQLASSGGVITDAYSYSAFGKSQSTSGSTLNPFRYGGQWNDPRTGHYNLRARWMDPRVGRFQNADPFEGWTERPSSLHRYIYADANPASRFDPTGRFSISEQAVATAITGGLVNVGFTFVFNGGSLTPGEGLGAFAFGAALTPVGGIAARVLGPLLKPLTVRTLQAVGRLDRITLYGKAGWQKALVRIGRVFANTNRHYPRVQDTAVGRLLIRLTPQVEWQQHHVFIQQCWSRVGSGSQIYDDLLANRGLQRIGNGLWNLLPVPAQLNNWLGRPGNEVAAQVFATFYYSVLSFGPFHLADMVNSLDE